MTLDERINLLTDLLRKLTVEYEVFFSGGRREPPTNLRFRVDNVVKQLLEEPMGYAQKFKFNQLVAKYSLYKDLWRRNTQDLEEGGSLRSESEIERLLKRQQAQVDSEAVPPDRVTVQIGDPATESDKIERLYADLQRIRALHGERPLDLNQDQFVDLVKMKTVELRAHHPGAPVEFAVYHDEQNRRVRFVARAGDADTGQSQKPGVVPPPSKKV